MAAYAALVSLMHIIDQIQHHLLPPISLDKSQVESLIEKVIFLQDFLECYSHGGSAEEDGLESRIANAVYAAEDVIESHIVDQILAGSTSHGEKFSSIDFYQGLEKVIEDMDSIKKEMMEVKEKKGVRDQPHRSSAISDGSIRFPSKWQNRTMVGFDDVLNEVIDKLTGHQYNLQIIPIVGMGGIGKTTLARNIYENQVVVKHFDILAWVTISQEYSMREIILEVLHEGGENMSQMNEYELGGKLHKRLSGRRYLIIMDDIWNIEAWDQLKLFFPDNNNGSRIMLTTRLSKLAFQLTGTQGLEMKFLDEDTSWNLLCKNVFGKEDCPPELERIGKKIAQNCKGLPLSIVVIGGLLAKSEQTQEYWGYISENLNSIVSLEDDEHCLKILYTSYNNLPVQLKPCFLYMGVFPEDSEINVSELIKLWVAEGFLKTIDGRSLEEAAEEYLKELINRNLILVHKWGSSGKLKFCKIHDLLRDLCIREARKQKFLCVLKEQSLNIPQGISTERRICIHKSTSGKNYSPQIPHALESSSLVRSLIWQSQGSLQSFSFRLLRVYSTGYNSFDAGDERSLESIFQKVNLRYLAVALHPLSRFPSSVSLLWNLQTLIVVSDFRKLIAPSEIWKMPQLRHVKLIAVVLPDPPSGRMGGRDDIVLENLQTIKYIKNFKFGEEVVKRIPNVKKLKIYYEEFEEGSPDYYLNNLSQLHKLESLGCYCDPKNKPSHSLQTLTFPHSLKKLTLEATRLHWEDLTTKIGSLPLLQVLKLSMNACEGPHWETDEGQFCSLKFLLIEFFDDLECWTTDSTHFPCLEHLGLRSLKKLTEIPWGIGDIPTLQSMEVFWCSYSAVISAKRILEEQEELGNEGLQIRVGVFEHHDEELHSLVSQNFQVEFR